MLPAQDRPAASPIAVQIHPEQVLARTSRRFLGFGYETSALARPGYFSPRNATLIQLLKNLGQGGLLRIGGNVSDYAHYEPDGRPQAMPQRQRTVYTRTELTELGAFLRATGWLAMWGLNVKTGTSAEAVTSAVAVREALGDRLHSFEVGNETDLMPQFNGRMAEYLATYRAYKTAIRAVLPEAPFAGPDAALGTRWVEQFAREEPEAVVLTRHYYRGGAKDPASTIERLRQPDARWLHQVEVLREISAKAKVPFRINEINSLFGGGKKGVSDTFAATLWCLDTLLLLAANGCDGVNLQTDINHLAWVSEYSPIYRYPDDRLEARPAYYGLLAFAVAGIGDVLACTTDQAPEGVRILAVRSADGDVWVTALSQDPSAQVQLSIRLPPSLGTARCLRLVAPALDRTDQVTLGGSAVAPDGTWSPAQTEELAVQDGVASVNLPGASAALVRLGH